jgi:hypothetical protein
MKLKMKLMAAAVALVAASGANAGIANSTTGNGSLVLFAYDTVAHTTAMFDLGVEMNSFLPAAMSSPAGGSITWNLGGSSVSGTGAYASFTSALSYGSTFANFAPATSVKWGVIALDQTGTAAGDDRYLSTSKDSLGIVDNVTKSNLVAFSGVDSFLNGHNNAALHAGNANGASLSGETGTNSNALHQNGFGSADKWATKSQHVATDFAGTAMKFYMLDTGGALTTARVTEFGNAQGAATFLYNDTAGTLTFNQVAAIPEPETYALLLAGLGMLGFIGRRRLNTRV